MLNNIGLDLVEIGKILNMIGTILRWVNGWYTRLVNDFLEADGNYWINYVWFDGHSERVYIIIIIIPYGAL